jgi:hypothetical protein
MMSTQSGSRRFRGAEPAGVIALKLPDMEIHAYYFLLTLVFYCIVLLDLSIIYDGIFL